MTRYISLSLLIIVISVLDCSSQNDWKKGYIIKSAGDTIHGLIDLRDSKSNSKQCYFKIEENSKKMVLSPLDIIGYGLNSGKFYISKNIKELNSREPVFLEFLIKGKVNIYHYRGDTDLYFLEKDGKIYELKNTREVVDVNNNDFLLEKKEYIGILNASLQDADMQKEIKECKLNTNSLINIAKKYHERVCSDEKCIVYEMQKAPLNIRYSAFTGLSLSTLNFADVTKSNPSLGAMLGCRFELDDLVDWQENICYSIDMTLQYFSNYKLRQISSNYISYIKYNDKEYILELGDKAYGGVQSLNVNIKTLALKIPITINYTFSKNRIKPYLGIGMQNMFVLSQNKSFVYQQIYEKYSRSFRVYNFGIIGRGGCKIGLNGNHEVYLEFNYEYTLNSADNSYRLTNSLSSITTGYTF